MTDSSLVELENLLLLRLGALREQLLLAEAKNGAIAVLSVMLLAGEMTVLPSVPSTSTPLIWFVAFAMTLQLLAAVIALLSFLPVSKMLTSLVHDSSPRSPNCVNVFHIASLNVTQYIDEAGPKSSSDQEEALITGYSDQIIALAKIAVRKFEFSVCAAWLLIAGLVTLPVALFIWLAIREGGPK